MNDLHKSRKSSSRLETKPLTFGDLIVSTYGACGEHLAPKILQLALASHLVQLKRTL